MRRRDGLSLSIAQIDNLVSLLNKKGFKTASAQILQICSRNPEALEPILLFQLLSKVYFSRCDINKLVKDSPLLHQLLQELCRHQSKPHFGSLIGFAVQSLLDGLRNESQPILSTVAKILENVSPPVKLSASLSLSRANSSETQVYFVNWFNTRAEELFTQSNAFESETIESVVQFGNKLFQDLGSERLNYLLIYLLSSTNRTRLPPKIAAALLKGIRRAATSTQSQALTWYLPPSHDVVKTSDTVVDPALTDVAENERCYALADILVDLGPIALSTAQAASLLLSSIAPKDLTPRLVALGLCAIIGNPKGKPPSAQTFVTYLKSCDIEVPDDLQLDEGASQWRVGNLVKALLITNPGLAFNQVLQCLDSADFRVRDAEGLLILKEVIINARQNGESISLDVFCSPWKHESGQFSLLRQCCLHPEHSVIEDRANANHLRWLSIPPSQEKMPWTLLWKNVEFMRALFNLATNNRAFFNEIASLMTTALTAVPEVFTGTLLLSNGMPGMKKQMLARIISHYLLPRENSQVVLQAIWTGAMTYLTEDQRRSQRNLLLSQCYRLVNAWCFPIEPQLPQGSFHSLIALLLRIRGNPVPPLAVLLGSPKSPVSMAFCNVFALRLGAADVSSNWKEGWWAPPISRLTLALSFLFFLLDGVSSENARAFMANLFAHQTQLEVQKALDEFLLIWFHEQLKRDPEEANTFCEKVIFFLRASYPTLVEPIKFPLRRLPGDGPKEMRLFSPRLEQNRHLSSNFSRPPVGIMRHILKALDTALNDSSTRVSDRIRTETQATLDTFVTNLDYASNALSRSLRQAVSLAAGSGGGVGGGGGGVTWHAPISSESDPSRTSIVHPRTIQRTTAVGSGGVGVSSLSMAGGTQPPPQRGPGGGGGGGTDTSGTAQNPGPPIYLDFESQILEIEAHQNSSSQVNNFFSKLFNSGQTIEDVMQVLLNYGTAEIHKPLFDDILKNLALEYAVHLSEYPDNVLPAIIEFYAMILNNLFNLLSVPALTMLWKAVVMHLYSTEVHMDAVPFRCSVSILQKTKGTFTRYANLATELLNCPEFRMFPSDLKDAIVAADNYGKNYRVAANTHSHLGGSQSLKDLQMHAQHQQQQQILLQQQQQQQQQQQHQAPGSGADEYSPPEPPEESVRDRISFIFNNVAIANYKEKATEIASTVEPAYLAWLAHYIVNKRVVLDSTFLEVFDKLVDELDRSHLNNFREVVVGEVYRAIKTILRCLRADVEDASTKNSLKSLGKFLGMLTLQKNTPILHDDLNLKELLLEAEGRGALALAFVVPLVAAIMRTCAGTVFAPPCPYTMAILRVLRELYEYCDIKVYLKFEIEMVMNELVKDLKSVEPAEYLRNPANSCERRLIGFAAVAATNTAPASTAAPTVSVAPQQQQSVVSRASYEASNALECNPRSLAALAQQQQQRFVAAAAAQQSQQLYSTGARSNVFSALLESAAAHRGDTGGLYPPYGGNAAIAMAAAADEPFRRKWDPSLVALQQQQQQQQSQHPGRQHPLYAQQQQQPAQQLSQQLQGAASTYSTAANVLSHVVSAPQLANAPRDFGGEPGSSALPLFHYEEVDLTTVLAAVNIDDILLHIQKLTETKAIEGASSEENKKIIKASAAPLVVYDPQDVSTAFSLLRMEAVQAVLPQALERALRETLYIMVEKYVPTAVATTEALLRKDFAFHPSDVAMSSAGRQMVRHLTASAVFVNARDALRVSLVNHLYNLLNQALKNTPGANPASLTKGVVDLIENAILDKAMDVSVAFLQKKTAEKAVAELEKRLEPDFKLRRGEVVGGHRRFPEVMAQTQAALPECVQKNSEILHCVVRLGVYAEFDRSIPGFAPLGAPQFAPLPPPQQPQATQLAFQRSTNAMLASAASQQAVASLGQQPAQLAMAKYIYQHQQYLQQQQGPSTNNQPQQQQPQPPQPPAPQQQANQAVQQKHVAHLSCLETAVSNLRGRMAQIASLLPSGQQDGALVRSLQALLDATLQIKSMIGMVAVDHAWERLITLTIQSFFTHYHPAVWAEVSTGQDLMDRVREAHMISLQLFCSIEQHPNWLVKTVTYVWIQLPDGSEEQHRELHECTPKVEQLSTLATQAVAKTTTDDGGALKWNWEAFAELLRMHVVYLNQVDDFLHKKVRGRHTGAVNFALNLLDLLVLPVLSGTTNLNMSAAWNTPASPIAALLASNSTTRSIPTKLGNILALESRREFTVLNEFDLWLTARALYDLQKSTLITPGDLNMRLRLTCGRLKALFDWGLLESESITGLFSPDSAECASLFAGFTCVREYDDPQVLKKKTEVFMGRWTEVYRVTGTQSSSHLLEIEHPAEQVMKNFIDSGFYGPEESVTRFFRLATTYVVERARNFLKTAEGTNAAVMDSRRNATYVELDAFARLICIVVNHPVETSAKVALLNRILGIIGGMLMQTHEIRSEHFFPMPFERILVMLFVDLFNLSPRPASDGSNPAPPSLLDYVPIVYGRLLHTLRPAKAPKFTLAFLEIVAHRQFVEQTLKNSVSPQFRAAYRCVYAQLLADVLNYLSFFLVNSVSSKPVNAIYVATFRLCLVLFHDFPDFLSHYCHFFCNIIVSSAVQMRNIFLSSEVKKSSAIADPLNAPPVDQLSQMDDPTGYVMEAGSRLPPLLKADIDFYLTTRAPVKLLTDLPAMLRRVESIADLLTSPPLLLTSALSVEQQQGGGEGSNETVAEPPQPQGKKAKKAAAAKAAAVAAQQQAVIAAAAEQANMAVFAAAQGSQSLSVFGMSASMHYSVELVTDLVVYLCITAVKALRETGQPLNIETVANTPQMEILQSLTQNLDDEGRYLLLNCMANQLRSLAYSHTYYFSAAILYLFANTPLVKAKEQISRVLMERLIVNRPHPFGLLVTSSELLRNPVYRYWDHDFVRCHKEMEDIVTVVARSCTTNFTPPSSSTNRTAVPGAGVGASGAAAVAGSVTLTQAGDQPTVGGGGGAPASGSAPNQSAPATSTAAADAKSAAPPVTAN